MKHGATLPSRRGHGIEHRAHAESPSDTPIERTLALKIQDFLPPDCIAGIEDRLLEIPDVQSASLNHLTGELIVTVAAGTSPETVAERLRRIGYECGSRPSTTQLAHAEHRAHQTGQPAEHDHHAMMERDIRLRFFVVLAFTIPVLLLSPTIQSWAGFRLPDLPGDNLLLVILASAIAIYGGVPFYRGAVKALRAHTADMDVLVSLAVLAGYLYSLGATFLFLASDFYWEVSTLVLFLLFGHWMEMRSVRGASGALRELVKLIPPTASRIRPDGSTEDIETARLEVEDVVLVRPGEKVPIDGIVIGGESSVNEALVTGESKPVPKRTGDAVLGGTINGEGSLRVRVTKIGEETALAQIVNLVRQAQETKPTVQRLADRAATALTLIAVTLGVATYLYWFGLARTDSLFALTLMITVFVIACPHALGLAVPTVTIISTTMAARNGILILNAEGLEVAKDLQTVIFDKTGTLTTGRFGVSEVVAFDPWKEADLLRLAAAVERNSEHVIAKAIVAHAESNGVTIPDAVDFTAIPGKGARAKVDRHAVVLGNRALLEDMGLGSTAEADRLAAQGKTTVLVMLDDRLAGVITLADVIRGESREAVAELKAMGLRVAMLTGDNRATAAYVAEQLRLDTFFAEVLPGDKAAAVERLQKVGQRVAMIGDGVNDAPALVQADVGIAIGAGTDVAVESADIVLVRNDPRDVVRLVRLSRLTSSKMRQNLVWATGYNAVALPLAAGVGVPAGIVLRPEWGALFMAASSIIVVTNALLMKRRQI